MRTTLCVLAAVLAGLTASVAPAGAASAPFSAPFAIGHTDQGGKGYVAGVSLLHTASDGRGDLAIGWTNSHGAGSQSLELVVRTVDHKLLRARTIYTTSGAVSQPALVMDAAGDTLVVFTRYTDAFTRRAVMVIDVSRAGRVGHATRISPAGVLSENASVAEAPGGRAVVVFQRDAAAPRTTGLLSAVPEDVMASTRSPGGHFGLATAVSSVDPRAANATAGSMDPTVAVSADRTATAAWNLGQTRATISQNGTGVVQTASAPAGGTFAAAVALGSSTVDFPVSLAEDAKGDTLAAWTHATFALTAAARQAGASSFSPAVALSHPTQTGQSELNGTAVTVASDGDGRVLWTYGGADHGGQLATATWRPGASVAPGSTVTPHATVGTAGSFPPYTGDPSAVHLQNRTLVIWQESALQTDGRDGSGNNSLVTLEYTVAPAAGAFGSGRLALDRSFKASNGLLLTSTLVGGGSGRVYLVYLQDNGTVDASRLIAAK